MTDEKKSLIEHFEELRKTLLYALLGLLIAVIGSLFIAEKVIHFLAIPIGGMDKLNAIEVTESIGVYMRVALLTGLLIALPWIFYQVFKFVGKGLTEKEKKAILIAVPFATIMFLGGVSFAYLVMLPASLEFLMGVLSIQTVIRIKSYYSFVTNLLFWIGVSFEIPLIAYVLARFGLLKAQAMLKGWRVAIVLIAVLAAVITPTSDPVNMAIFMIPLFVLYLLSIGLAALAEKQRGKTDLVPKSEV